jgi:hypothetical protein
MGMRRLRYIFAVCGAGVLLAVAAQAALAASEQTLPGAHAKPGTPSVAHRSASRAQPKAARPASHKTTAHKEHKKELAARPATTPSGPADKPLDQRPGFGPFSFGVETDTKVKRRSIRGGEYDPERDGDQSKGFRPPFLGLSLKSQFSW